MGWQDRHVHRFTTHHPVTGEKLRFGTPEVSDFYGSSEVVPGWQVQLRDVLRPDYPPIIYTYDLGDEWQHEISLEAVVPAVEAGPCPQLPGRRGRLPAGGLRRHARLPAAPGGPGRADDAAARRGPCACSATASTRTRFDPQDVAFSDPRRRWAEFFGED